MLSYSIPTGLIQEGAALQNVDIKNILERTETLPYCVKRGLVSALYMTFLSATFRTLFNVAPSWTHPRWVRASDMGIWKWYFYLYCTSIVFITKCFVCYPPSVKLHVILSVCVCVSNIVQSERLHFFFSWGTIITWDISFLSSGCDNKLSRRYIF